MTRSTRGDGSTDAAEFMAELTQDEEYQARRRAFDADLAERAEALRQAETPIVDDLKAMGLHLSSVWDLVNSGDDYRDALPILLAHRERGGYPERVLESLGRALAVRDSVAYWDRLKGLWLNARTHAEGEGVAVAMAACATEAQVPDLVNLLGREDRGASRLLFIEPVLALGGEAGRQVVEGLQDHPVLAEEAKAVVRRASSGESRPHDESCADGGATASDAQRMVSRQESDGGAADSATDGGPCS